MKKIDQLAESMGIEEEGKTVFSIRDTDNPSLKELVLRSGQWREDQPMFAYLEQDPKQLYVFVSADTFAQLMNALKHANEENFNLKLEKAILRQIPLDFEDVRLVAMDRIRDLISRRAKEGKPLQINLDELVSEIKREHPSLFVNLRELLGPEGTSQL